jgi:hypothetical protein
MLLTGWHSFGVLKYSSPKQILIMATKAKSTRVEGLLAMYDLQTGFLERALVGISEKDMHNRMNTEANHMAWLAGSLVAQRFLMASDIKPELKQTGAELFSNNKGIQADATYPTNDAYIKDWNTISPHAREALAAFTDEKLDSEMDMGGMKMTWHDLVTFTLYREANMIGQLALWRRLLGYPALKYD